MDGTGGIVTIDGGVAWRCLTKEPKLDLTIVIEKQESGLSKISEDHLIVLCGRDKYGGSMLHGANEILWLIRRLSRSQYLGSS